MTKKLGAGVGGLLWLLTAFLIIGATVFVTREEHYAAIKYKGECYSNPSARTGPIPGEQTETSADKCKDPKEYMPWWYVLIAWPEGITVWAIIATGLVIAWQAKETARAANATQLATELAEKNIILQFRPKIIVRKVFLHDGTDIPTAGVPDAIPWTIDFVLVNTGGSRATIKRSGFEFNAFKDGDIPPRLEYKMLEPSDPVRLQPGEEKNFSVGVPSNLVSLFRMTGTRYRDSAQKTRYTYFWGCVQYADDAGVIRNTAVCRHYDLEIGKFTNKEDSDYEYAD